MNIRSNFPRTLMSTLIALVMAAALAGCSNAVPSSQAGADAGNPDSLAMQIAKAHHDAEHAASARAPLPDACSLVSQADAENILGGPVKSGEHAANDEHATHCQYETTCQGSDSLIVEIQANDNVAEARQGQEIKRHIYGGDTAENAYRYEVLRGIGDDAFLVTNKQPAGMPAQMVDALPDQQMLFAIKGANGIELNTNYSGKPRSADSLEALAKKIAEHL